jgi:hypothetical protein
VSPLQSKPAVLHPWTLKLPSFTGTRHHAIAVFWRESFCIQARIPRFSEQTGFNLPTMGSSTNGLAGTAHLEPKIGPRRGHTGPRRGISNLNHVMKQRVVTAIRCFFPKPQGVWIVSEGFRHSLEVACRLQSQANSVPHRHRFLNLGTCTTQQWWNLSVSRTSISATRTAKCRKRRADSQTIRRRSEGKADRIERVKHNLQPDGITFSHLVSTLSPKRVLANGTAPQALFECGFAILASLMSS